MSLSLRSSQTRNKKLASLVSSTMIQGVFLHSFLIPHSMPFNIRKIQLKTLSYEYQEKNVKRGKASPRTGGGKVGGQFVTVDIQESDDISSNFRRATAGTTNGVPVPSILAAAIGSLRSATLAITRLLSFEDKCIC